MTPKASFVIPAYNSERWISKAIESCRNQTVKPIEIIVVNDGSTDSTEEIAFWHAKEDSRINFINLKENKGRSYARNTGNAAAKSDLILVLDADDMATRTRAKDTIDLFNLTNCDVAFGSYFVMDFLGRTHSKYLSQAFDPIKAKEYKLNFICHSTMAYKKSVSQKIKYDEGVYSQMGFDDWKFQWDAYKAGFVFKNIKSCLCYKREYRDGILEDGSVNKFRDEKKVFEIKDEYLAKA